MNEIKERALVLKVTPFGNTSLIAHCFTEEHGRLPLLSRGARRPKSEFSGYLSVASYLNVSYLFKETRNVHLFTAIAYEKPFYTLLSSLESSAIAFAICEILFKILPEGQNHLKLFLKTVELLDELDQKRINYKIAFLSFLLILAKELGFSVPLSSCARCHRKLEEGSYLYESASFLCSKCQAMRGNRSQFLSKNSVNTLKRLSNQSISESMENINAFSYGDFIVLRKILLHFIGFHNEQHISLKSLEILDKIKQPE